MNALVHFPMILTRQGQKILHEFAGTFFQDSSKIGVFKSSTGEEIGVNLLLTGM